MQSVLGFAIVQHQLLVLQPRFSWSSPESRPPGTPVENLDSREVRDGKDDGRQTHFDEAIDGMRYWFQRGFENVELLVRSSLETHRRN